MKENEIIINDKSTIKRIYLQIAKVGKGLPIVLIAVVILCAAAWLFFGQITVCIKGYCEPSDHTAVLMLPINYKTEISSGDPIWVGNNAGRIETVFGESYFTYDAICNSEDIVLRNFLGSGQCDKNMSYILCTAEFPTDISGIMEYRIVTDTITPWQKFTDGKNHE